VEAVVEAAVVPAPDVWVVFPWAGDPVEPFVARRTASTTMITTPAPPAIRVESGIRPLREAKKDPSLDILSSLQSEQR
jgi:hypothetical protein